MTLGSGLHEVGVRTVGVRTLRHNQIFRMVSLPNFFYPWCSAGALARERAKLQLSPEEAVEGYIETRSVEVYI